jgi:hypothetical protein
MNNFRTEIILKKSHNNITHKSNILTIGSCFSENIGNLLIQNKFNVLVNPFGILYNPYSIKDCLEKTIDNYKFTEKDIINYQNNWYSFYHHGRYSNIDKNHLLDEINSSIIDTHNFFKHTDYLFITLGSSYVYKYIENNIIVANCHKIPNKNFNQYILSFEDILNEWKNLLEKILYFNSNLKIIFTVSPIRYLKYGSEMNQLSKSIIILLINSLKNEFSNIEYFPAYEIFMDDLRDYRFYKQDMIHPSDFAIEYVWEKISNHYFNDETMKIMNDIKSIHLAMNHRPRNINSLEYIKFLETHINKINALKEKYNFIDLKKELDYFTQLIN